jgi:hypothetical protein
VAGSYLWAWTAVGAALELLFQILPVALGLTTTIDAGLARVFFSWTLHAIVYFWLMPTYIAYYTIVPRAIGGPAVLDLGWRGWGVVGWRRWSWSRRYGPCGNGRAKAMAPRSSCQEANTT